MKVAVLDHCPLTAGSRFHRKSMTEVAPKFETTAGRAPEIAAGSTVAQFAHPRTSDLRQQRLDAKSRE